MVQVSFHIILTASLLGYDKISMIPSKLVQMFFKSKSQISPNPVSYSEYFSSITPTYHVQHIIKLIRAQQALQSGENKGGVYPAPCPLQSSLTMCPFFRRVF